MSDSPDRENQDLKKGGVKHDLGKDRWDLLSWPAIRELVKVLTFGAIKYEDHNWTTGINYSRCVAAALRHISSRAEGERNDPETGLNHLAHAMCCLMFLLTYDLFPEKYKKYDDLHRWPGTEPRPIRGPRPPDSQGEPDYTVHENAKMVGAGQYLAAKERATDQ